VQNPTLPPQSGPSLLKSLVWAGLLTLFFTCSLGALYLQAEELPERPVAMGEKH
jgi:hypothetical protein